mgnify:CR=1 FL=1
MFIYLASGQPISRKATEHSSLHSVELARGDIKESDKLTKHPFNIVFVSAEVAPYSKTGGLGDVCGSLPIALAARGNRVMVISPRYMNGADDHKFSGAFDAQCRIALSCFDGEHEVAFFHEFRAGVDWVFLTIILVSFVLFLHILSYMYMYMYMSKHSHLLTYTHVSLLQ